MSEDRLPSSQNYSKNFGSEIPNNNEELPSTSKGRNEGSNCPLRNCILRMKRRAEFQSAENALTRMREREREKRLQQLYPRSQRRNLPPGDKTTEGNAILRLKRKAEFESEENSQKRISQHQREREREKRLKQLYPKRQRQKLPGVYDSPESGFRSIKDRRSKKMTEKMLKRTRERERRMKASEDRQRKKTSFKEVDAIIHAMTNESNDDGHLSSAQDNEIPQVLKFVKIEKDTKDQLAKEETAMKKKREETEKRAKEAELKLLENNKKPSAGEVQSSIFNFNFLAETNKAKKEIIEVHGSSDEDDNSASAITKRAMQKNKMDTKKNDKQTKIGRKSNATILATASLLDSYLQDCQQQPPSPASSSTSQTTGDTTFEPSIDMMVNDFDDEQTLTEEEALAELEAQDPADEIETLQKESEMPLEKLLLQYRHHIHQDYQQQRRHKRTKSIKKHKQSRSKQQQQSTTGVSSSTSSSAKNNSTAINPNVNSTVLPPPLPPPPTIDEVIVIEESEDEIEILKTEQTDTDVGEDESSMQEVELETTNADADADEEDGDDEEDAEAEFDDCSFDNDPGEPFNLPREHTKLTALALLYPDKYANIQDKMDDDFSDEDDDDDDYVKKTIMVGASYQAIIPMGLSKYGDVLPYENEDKLIWEPSQVSEQEVEDYLIRVKELKSSPNLLTTQDDDIPSSSASVTSESDQGLGSSTVKDDEQALHLLVQCGYNFKEALRRKRLNAVPLTGSMSLWSEEECRNFEEGIQKFGKDFRKIRQTQVRTRSIRELVQFYYLWKKTERRDQDFVDSDTIDHMDAYLDYDERDTTASNGGSKHASSCLLSSDSFLSNQELPSKKHHHHNFSIMNETNRSSSGGHHNLNANSIKTSPNNKKSQRRRSSSLLSGTKSKHHHNHKNEISNMFAKKTSPETQSSTSPAASGKNCRNSCTNSTSSPVNVNTSSSSNNLIGNRTNKK